MKRWSVITLVALLTLSSAAAFGQADEGLEPEVAETGDEGAETEEIYLDEEYEERNRWGLGLAVGLVELDDLVIDGETIVSADDVEPYFLVNLRIPFGDRQANYGTSRGGFQGYLEPEISYWDGEQGSDVLVGVNIIGGVPFNAVEFFVGGGIGVHFIDVDLDIEDFEGGSDTALGVNAQFGVDVSVSKNLAFFGVGRFDLVDDSRDAVESKAYVGLRLRF